MMSRQESKRNRKTEGKEFESVSLGDSAHLALIVGSSALIALAGQIAHTSSSDFMEPVQSATEQVLEADDSASSIEVTLAGQTLPKEEFTQPASLAAFADAEIRNFEDRLSGLVERAEAKAEAASNPLVRQELAKNLKLIEEKITATRSAFIRLTKHQIKSKASSDRVFLEEDLKGHLFALQDAWDKSAYRVITLLETSSSPYTRTASRTGQ